MESIQEKSGFDARIKVAEAYESHGLYQEAVTVYREILSGFSDLSGENRTAIEEKIDKLSRELEDVEQGTPRQLSQQDVSHIKSGLSIGGSAPEISDSAKA
ncbi:MAG: hypothetical protein KGY38_05570, partial [Desulfobacterales bacterium]|nr:hypothetical protein [Desulfobacterales bacterium]